MFLILGGVVDRNGLELVIVVVSVVESVGVILESVQLES